MLDSAIVQSLRDVGAKRTKAAFRMIAIVTDKTAADIESIGDDIAQLPCSPALTRSKNRVSTSDR